MEYIMAATMTVQMVIIFGEIHRGILLIRLLSHVNETWDMMDDVRKAYCKL